MLNSAFVLFTSSGMDVAILILLNVAAFFFAIEGRSFQLAADGPLSLGATNHEEAYVRLTYPTHPKVNLELYQKARINKNGGEILPKPLAFRRPSLVITSFQADLHRSPNNGNHDIQSSYVVRPFKVQLMEHELDFTSDGKLVPSNNQTPSLESTADSFVTPEDSLKDKLKLPLVIEANHQQSNLFHLQPPNFSTQHSNLVLAEQSRSTEESKYELQHDLVQPPYSQSRYSIISSQPVYFSGYYTIPPAESLPKQNNQTTNFTNQFSIENITSEFFHGKFVNPIVSDSSINQSTEYFDQIITNEQHEAITLTPTHVDQARTTKTNHQLDQPHSVAQLHQTLDIHTPSELNDQEEQESIHNIQVAKPTHEKFNTDHIIPLSPDVLENEGARVPIYFHRYSTKTLIFNKPESLLFAGQNLLGSNTSVTPSQKLGEPTSNGTLQELIVTAPRRNEDDSPRVDSSLRNHLPALESTNNKYEPGVKGLSPKSAANIKISEPYRNERIFSIATPYSVNNSGPVTLTDQKDDFSKLNDSTTHTTFSSAFDPVVSFDKTNALTNKSILNNSTFREKIVNIATTYLADFISSILSINEETTVNPHPIITNQPSAKSKSYSEISSKQLETMKVVQSTSEKERETSSTTVAPSDVTKNGAVQFQFPLLETVLAIPKSETTPDPFVSRQVFVVEADSRHSFTTDTPLPLNVGAHMNEHHVTLTEEDADYSSETVTSYPTPYQLISG